MTIYEFFTLMGGVGMFLYGMSIMSTGLKNAAGDKMKTILEYATSNRGMMTELLDNLIQNAIRYNVPNGTVLVEVEKEENKGILSVSDTGIGIPETDQGRVFERFYRVDKSRSRDTGGTGLGFSIVKHIVELHDGRLELESRLGKGTTFRVVL